MDFATVGQLIGSLGFPIVACGALFWQMNKNETARREDNAKTEELRHEDNGKFVEAINNNTLVMSKVLDKLGG